ncbi:septum formation initiator family protein [Candidatus Falkowbacteria bacterium]|nr:septum formation initiator family protein [Candidatus Falkowbacteria bacterium]
MSLRLSRLLHSKLFLVIGGTVLIFLIAAFGRGFSQRYALEQQVKSLQTDINGLESKNQEFQQMIGYFDTENFTEAEARLKLGLKKPGEAVVVITQNGSGGASANGEMAEQLSNPAKWWYYFLH